MIDRYLGRYLLMLPGLLTILVNLPVAQASSNDVFVPYLDQIKTKIAPGLLFRLPSINWGKTENNNNYSVKVSPSLVNSGITVSIFNCKLESQACLMGNFSVNAPTSLGSREELTQHKTRGEAIDLDNHIRGYLINGQTQNPPSQFSSVMWEQDGFISRVRFRDENPQNSQTIVAIATSMATATPMNNLLNHDDLATKNIREVSILPKPKLPIQPQVSSDNSDNIAKSNNQISTTDNSDNIAKPNNQISTIIPPDNPTHPLEFVAPKPRVKSETSRQIFPIRDIQITGNTVFSEDKINPIIQEFEGKDFTNKEYSQTIQEVIDNINILYQKQGYIAAAKASGNENPNNGIVEIKVIESRLQEIQIDGTKRLRSYVLSHLQLPLKKIVNTSQIEDKLRLLKQDPLFTSVLATIKPINNEGDKKLVVTVKEAPAVVSNISVDNFSPASVGSERVNIGLKYRNLTGLGDEFAANSSISNTGGSKLFNFGYTVPLNPMNGSLQLSATFNSTRVTESPFDVLKIQGDKQTYEIFYRQPLIHSSTEELALSLGFSFDNGQTFTFDKPTGFGFGPDKNGVTRTSTVVFRQDYRKSGISGNWFLESEFKIGTGFFNPTSNSSPVPDGYFFSWDGLLQREQHLSNNNSLVVKANLQLTPDGLLPSQQFIIGGGQSVRGYRQSARSGDNGLTLSIEDRISLNSKFQVVPFLDLGTVWNVSNNPNKLAPQTFLISPGLGIIWRPLQGLKLQVDYAFPFINLEDKGSNVQGTSLYFNVNYQP